MLNIMLAIHLLIVVPAINFWRSLLPKDDKLPRTRLFRYWCMSRNALILLGILWVGCEQASYTTREIGFDFPLSKAGVWGLCFAVLLLSALFAVGSILEQNKMPQAVAESDVKLLNSPFPWPRNGVEILAFVLSMTLTTTAWEILYRGFVLLLLVPSTGVTIAVAASAIAYGTAHGYKTPKQLLTSIVSAFVFTIAYALTHSLWWLIVIHAGLPLAAVPAVLRARKRHEA